MVISGSLMCLRSCQFERTPPAPAEAAIRMRYFVARGKIAADRSGTPGMTGG
jgi:hypothetical protein